MNILCLRLFVNIFNFFLKKQKTNSKSIINEPINVL